MSEDMSRREYWAEVNTLAQEIQAETLDDMDGEPGEDWTEDDYREALYERVWETIDGHQWVIYTAYNMDVLRFSDNDGYSAEQFGPESILERNGSGINWAAMAFGALYADVMDRISAVPIELPEAVAALLEAFKE